MSALGWGLKPVRVDDVIGERGNTIHHGVAIFDQEGTRAGFVEQLKRP